MYSEIKSFFFSLINEIILLNILRYINYSTCMCVYGNDVICFDVDIFKFNY